MQVILVEQSRAVGMLLAFLTFAFGVWLRFSGAIRVASVLGLFLPMFVLVNILAICFYHQSHREQLPLGPLWIRLAGALALLLGIAAVLGAIDTCVYGIPWYQAFGVLWDEAGIVLGVYLIGNALQYKLANILGVGNSTQDTLASYKEARVLVSAVYVTMAWTLLIEESVIPLIYYFRVHH